MPHAVLKLVDIAVLRTGIELQGPGNFMSPSNVKPRIGFLKKALIESKSPFNTHRSFLVRGMRKGVCPFRDPKCTGSHRPMKLTCITASRSREKGR